MSEGNMVYLGLCVRFNPPIIGIHYKNKQSDEKKKLYTIVLNRLVLNPNPMQVAEQLYLEHPHILKESKIPKEKIAQLISKIQKELKIAQDYEQEEEGNQENQEEEEYQEDYEQQVEEEHYEEPHKQEYKKSVAPPAKKRPKFDFDNQFGKDDGPLNRSM